MSLQWTLVAAYLYVEVALICLLLLPFVSPCTWQKLFKSKFLQSIESQANFYFTGFLIILVILFVDSIREMRSHSIGREIEIKHGHLDFELQHSMKLFRAQRNFYIAGFALFLSLVIRRLVMLITTQAQLVAQSEASMKQAKSASTMSQSLLSDYTEADISAKSKVNSAEVDQHEEQVQVLKKLLADSRKELIKLQLNSDTMAKQATSVSTEYDRLMKEHEKLQRQLVTEDDSRKSL